MRETIPSVGVSQWRHGMERERERERGWKKEQMRQKAITRLEIEKRNQIKWRKVKFKDCANFRSKN